MEPQTTIRAPGDHPHTRSRSCTRFDAPIGAFAGNYKAPITAVVGKVGAITTQTIKAAP